jgi:hypothetical protein
MKHNKNVLRAASASLALAAIAGLALEAFNSTDKDDTFYLQTASVSGITNWTQSFHHAQVEASLEGTFKDQPDDLAQRLRQEAQDQVALGLAIGTESDSDITGTVKSVQCEATEPPEVVELPGGYSASAQFICDLTVLPKGVFTI